MEKKIDRRIVKTKRAICNALIELLSIKNLEEITITDIANKADVNRKTIYNYYMGIHEILGEIEDNLIQNLDYVLKDIDLRQGLNDPSKIFGPITEVLSSNLDFYGRLLNINLNSKFVFKLVSYLQERVKNLFIQQKVFPLNKIEMITNYVVTSLISSYQYWFNSGRVESIEEYSKDVHNLVYHGVLSFVNKQ